MASYTSSNVESERWAKIMEGVDSGRHPEIMIDDDGRLVAVSTPDLVNTRISSFLADVFKDGDNEWFSHVSDSVEVDERKSADDGQPESSKKKKISLTEQRASARQEKKDQGMANQRAEWSKAVYTPIEWEKITKKVCTLEPPGIFLEGKNLVATDSTLHGAENKLQLFTAFVLGQDTKPYLYSQQRGASYPSRR